MFDGLVVEARSRPQLADAHRCTRLREECEHRRQRIGDQRLT